MQNVSVRGPEIEIGGSPKNVPATMTLSSQFNAADGGHFMLRPQGAA